MTDRPYRGAIDYERLAAYFRVLSAPNRVQLLHKLQWPLAISEIELPPFRKDRARKADRSLSRQAVENHLRQLQQVGLVRERPARREGQPTTEYLVNPDRLFVVTDELRRLGLIRPPPAAAKGWTRTGAERTAAAGGTPDRQVVMPAGPALVLVTGPAEGTAFQLDGAGPWRIGRGKGVEVAVPYDPFVSTENSELVRARDGLLVRDHHGSRNGTTLNWRLLGEGEEAGLRPGDTIGVGRSLLVFRI